MKKKKYFMPKAKLENLINSYFDNINNNSKTADPPTIGGLLLHLGFDDLEDLDRYESGGKFGDLIKNARFRVLAYYESRLHYPSPSGAIYALKTMGWEEQTKILSKPRTITSINIKLIETGPQPASSEKEVSL